jgi:hypothetical protein
MGRGGGIYDSEDQASEPCSDDMENASSFWSKLEKGCCIAPVRDAALVALTQGLKNWVWRSTEKR